MPAEPVRFWLCRRSGHRHQSFRSYARARPSSSSWTTATAMRNTTTYHPFNHSLSSIGFRATSARFCDRTRGNLRILSWYDVTSGDASRSAAATFCDHRWLANWLQILCASYLLVDHTLPSSPNFSTRRRLFFNYPAVMLINRWRSSLAQLVPSVSPLESDFSVLPGRLFSFL